MVVQAARIAHDVVLFAPDWIEGRITLARVQREIGEVESSLANYEVAHAMDPSDTRIIEELSEMQHIAARMRNVRETHENALQLSSSGQESEVIRCFFNLSSRAVVMKKLNHDTTCH